jgi:hypothetical protein
MPALRPGRWTIDEVEDLIDEREGISPRYELVDGELETHGDFSDSSSARRRCA